jgi:hypothetical protein
VIDNVEQIGIPAGAGGLTVLKVKAIGSFGAGITEEEFALATQENFVAALGPSFEIDMQHPASAAASSSFVISGSVLNAGDLPAHDVTITLNGASVTSGANPVNISMIAPNAAIPVQWTVSAAGDPGAYPISIIVNSNSYGEVFTGSDHSGYTVGPSTGEFLITNMPGNDGAQSGNLASGRIKAMGFTLPPGDDYTLDEVHLRLNITSLTTNPLVRIFDDVGGLPTNSLGTMVNPAITATGIANYIFTPFNTLTLEQETPYWLVVYNTVDNSMNWVASDPPQIPAGIAVHSGSLWNGNTGPNPPVDPSAIINSYTIIASPVSQGCYADCDGNQALNVDDFLCFINEFAQAQALTPAQQVVHYANCDGSTSEPGLTVDDFLCFINEFAAGCP